MINWLILLFYSFIYFVCFLHSSSLNTISDRGIIQPCPATCVFWFQLSVWCNTARLQNLLCVQKITLSRLYMIPMFSKGSWLVSYMQIFFLPLPCFGEIQHMTIDAIFLFFPENRLWHFLQIVSLGDSLHEMSNLFSGKNKKKNISFKMSNILHKFMNVEFPRAGFVSVFRGQQGVYCVTFTL